MRFFFGSIRCSEDIDFDLALEIGDFGDGSDAPTWLTDERVRRIATASGRASTMSALMTVAMLAMAATVAIVLLFLTGMIPGLVARDFFNQLAGPQPPEGRRHGRNAEW